MVGSALPTVTHLPRPFRLGRREQRDRRSPLGRAYPAVRSSRVRASACGRGAAVADVDILVLSVAAAVAYVVARLHRRPRARLGRHPPHPHQPTTNDDEWRRD